MKFLMLSAVFVIGTAAYGRSASTTTVEPHNGKAPTETSSVSRPRSSAEEKSEEDDGQQSYRLDSFRSCEGEKIYLDRKAPVVNGIRLVKALTLQAGKFFSPSNRNNPRAICSYIAVKANEVLGRVEPNSTKEGESAMDRYTIASGELLGKEGEEKRINFMMLPNPIPFLPPLWIPVPCSLQDKDNVQQLALTLGTMSRSPYKIESLVPEKDVLPQSSGREAASSPDKNVSPEEP